MPDENIPDWALYWYGTDQLPRLERGNLLSLQLELARLSRQRQKEQEMKQEKKTNEILSILMRTKAGAPEVSYNSYHENYQAQLYGWFIKTDCGLRGLVGTGDTLNDAVQDLWHELTAEGAVFARDDNLCRTSRSGAGHSYWMFSGLDFHRVEEPGNSQQAVTKAEVFSTAYGWIQKRLTELDRSDVYANKVNKKFAAVWDEVQELTALSTNGELAKKLLIERLPYLAEAFEEE